METHKEHFVEIKHFDEKNSELFGKARNTTLLKKRLLHRVFSCEFCEISINTFFTEQLRATASKDYQEDYK